MKARKSTSATKLDLDRERQCIWMRAGVINYKLCDNAYDCLSCPFDKAMSRSVRKGSSDLVSWREAMRERRAGEMECRHMLTGRVQYHYCSNGYRCSTCEFDQLLDESDLQNPPEVLHTRRISGFSLADGYHYHPGHSWARIEHGGFVRLGIDDFTLRLLGCPTEVCLPQLGAHIEQTEVGWSIHRGRQEASMFAPLTGVVVATNHKVLNDPLAAKKDPYGQGWLVVIEPKSLKQNLKSLLFEREAFVWLEDQAKKLEKMVADTYGMSLAATGGEVVDDIYANLPQTKWEDLVHTFLLT